MTDYGQTVAGGTDPGRRTREGAGARRPTSRLSGPAVPHRTQTPWKDHACHGGLWFQLSLDVTIVKRECQFEYINLQLILIAEIRITETVTLTA